MNVLGVPGIMPMLICINIRYGDLHGHRFRFCCREFDGPMWRFTAGMTGACQLMKKLPVGRHRTAQHSTAQHSTACFMCKALVPVVITARLQTILCKSAKPRTDGRVAPILLARRCWIPTILQLAGCLTVSMKLNLVAVRLRQILPCHAATVHDTKQKLMYFCMDIAARQTGRPSSVVGWRHFIVPCISVYSYVHKALVIRCRVMSGLCIRMWCKVSSVRVCALPVNVFDVAGALDSISKELHHIVPGQSRRFLHHLDRRDDQPPLPSSPSCLSSSSSSSSSSS